LKNGSFNSKGLKELKKLYLDHCGLEAIEFGAFNGLTKLTRLSLRHNELRVIIPGTFDKYSLLKYLDLSHNKIELFESDVFCGSVKINYINLKGNKLQYLHPDTFSVLPILQTLYLSENSDLQIPTDRPFITSHSLKLLGISGCNISSVSLETFVKVPSLECLDLSYNNLRGLDVYTLEVLPKLSVLYLHENPLHCSSQLLEVWRWCQHLNITTFNEGKAPECVTPWYWNGVSLGDLEKNPSLKNNTGDIFDLDFESYEIENQKSIHVGDLDRTQSIEDYTEGGHFLPKPSYEVDIQNFLRWRILGKHRPLGNIIVHSVDMNVEMHKIENPKSLHLGDLEKNQSLENNTGNIFDLDAESYEIENQKSIHLGDLEKNQSLENNTGDIFDLDVESYEIENRKSIHFEEYKYFVRHVRFPVLSVLSIFGITGNVILIIIITCDKDMRNVPNMYFFNLAISDLIFLTQTFLFATLDLLIPNTWQPNSFLFVFFQFCSQMAVGLTAYSVAVLSFQRYRVTANPLQARVSSQTTRRATVATICGVWIVAALLAVPTLILLNIYKSHTPSEYVTLLQFTSLFGLIFSCVLPLCVIIFSYCLTSRHLMKNYFSITGMAQIHQIKRRRHSAKVVLGLSIVFAISYVPSYFLSTFFSFYYKTIERDYVQYVFLLYVREICTFFLCLNSCLNPVAVFCTSLAFRMRLKRYLTSCCTNKFPSY